MSKESRDVIASIVSGDLTSAEEALNDLLNQRASDQIDNVKADVLSNPWGNTPKDEPVVEPEATE